MSKNKTKTNGRAKQRWTKVLTFAQLATQKRVASPRLADNLDEIDRQAAAEAAALSRRFVSPRSLLRRD